MGVGFAAPVITAPALNVAAVERIAVTMFFVHTPVVGLHVLLASSCTDDVDAKPPVAWADGIGVNGVLASAALRTRRTANVRIRIFLPFIFLLTSSFDDHNVHENCPDIAVMII